MLCDTVNIILLTKKCTKTTHIDSASTCTTLILYNSQEHATVSIHTHTYIHPATHDKPFPVFLLMQSRSTSMIETCWMLWDECFSDMSYNSLYSHSGDVKVRCSHIVVYSFSLGHMSQTSGAAALTHVTYTQIHYPFNANM